MAANLTLIEHSSFDPLNIVSMKFALKIGCFFLQGKQVTLACVECSQSLGHTGFAPAHGVYAFPVYTAQALGCFAGELSKVGPGLRALSRSKPLRFSFSGTPQRHRLSWACVMCPSQVRATQETRYLASAHSPGGTVCLITSLVPAARFPGCAVGAPSQVGCVSPLGS